MDVVEAASRFVVYPSTIRKIVDEKKSVSILIQQKMLAAVQRPSAAITGAQSFSRYPTVERLRYTHRLYQDLGTVESVGKALGLTRQRVSQLLVTGKKLGLFEYKRKPHEYPFVAKEKLLADYREYLSLEQVARANGITVLHLRKLRTAYRITDKRLRSLWIAGQRARCINDYDIIKERVGHHPLTTILQATGRGSYLCRKIVRFWGSIDAFRKELNIPALRKSRHASVKIRLRRRENGQWFAL